MSGKRSPASAAACALDKSRASASSFADGLYARIEVIASFTRASVRPLMMTRAPSAARALAIANPIPAVDPVTSAFFPFNSKFTGVRSFVYLAIGPSGQIFFDAGD